MDSRYSRITDISCTRCPKGDYGVRGCVDSLPLKAMFNATLTVVIFDELYTYIRPKVAVWISRNFRCQIKQHFPNFRKRPQTLRAIFKFSKVSFRNFLFQLISLPDYSEFRINSSHFGNSARFSFSGKFSYH